VFAILAAAAAPARADDLPLPSVQHPAVGTRILDSIQIAEHVLGAAPACELHIYIADLHALGDAAVSAMALCTIWLGQDQGNTPTARIYWCTILAHELAHILGYTDPIGVRSVDGHIDHSHSPDNHALMYTAAGNNVLYPCYQRFLPAGQGHSWRAHHIAIPWSIPPPPRTLTAAP
jgi:hypothetical protein